jgi:EAL domain-containing protein (putative c-di-GMP-specific phosphodiesterase class I)
MGGDEFAIILPRTDAAETRRVAEQLLDVLRRHTVSLRGQQISVTASMGAALYPEHSSQASDLVAFADLAMYRVKERGRNGFDVYTPGNAQLQIVSALGWERRIRDALDTNQFALYAQPIHSLNGGRHSCELLLRLPERDGSVTMPGAFLGVAERSGLIRAIDGWVVRQALTVIAAQQRVGNPLTLSLNLSGKSLGDAALLQQIEQDVDAAGIDTQRVVFEITETAAIADTDVALRFMKTMTRLGCRFAIDDFGSFVQNLGDDVVDQRLVKAMVDVARGLGKQTVAEFVGDEATVDLLRAMGVDYAQGYHIGRPRPIAEFLAKSATDAA